MQQTAFTGIQNIYKKTPFLGGFCKIWFIPVDEVQSIPPINPLNQFLQAEPVLFNGKAWRGPVPIPKELLGYTEQQESDPAGQYFKVKVSADSPGDAPQQRVNFDNMMYQRYLVVGKLRAGGFYVLLGGMDNPLFFDQDHSNGPGSANNANTKLAFTGKSVCRALVMPAFLGDNSGMISPGGGTGSPANNSEIIPFENVPVVKIEWTIVRTNKFGMLPEVECYLLGEDGKYFKYPAQPYIDAPPPSFSQMTFEFGGPQTGFIMLK